MPSIGELADQYVDKELTRLDAGADDYVGKTASQWAKDAANAAKEKGATATPAAAPIPAESMPSVEPLEAPITDPNLVYWKIGLVAIVFGIGGLIYVRVKG